MGLHVATIWLADCVFALVSSWTGVTKKKKVRSVTKNETFFQSYQNNRFKWISKAIYWCFCNRHVIVNDIKIKNSGYEGLIHNSARLRLSSFFFLIQRVFLPSLTFFFLSSSSPLLYSCSLLCLINSLWVQPKKETRGAHLSRKGQRRLTDLLKVGYHLN